MGKPPFVFYFILFFEVINLTVIKKKKETEIFYIIVCDFLLGLVVLSLLEVLPFFCSSFFLLSFSFLFLTKES